MAKGKSNGGDGHLSKPGSPAAWDWVNGLPDFLRETILEDWRGRGIVLPAAPVHKTDGITFADLGGILVAT